MSWLLDTNVVSELVRRQPEPKVIEWVDTQPESTLFLSVITIGEIRKGNAKLRDGRKRQRLTTWLNQDLRERFSQRLLSFDEEVALTWGDLVAKCEKAGIVVSTLDSQICAIALHHGMTVVTRDVRELEPTAVPVFSPWMQ